MKESESAPNNKRKVLFLCIGNSCRSQIAEAMARHYYPHVMEAESAGLAPLGSVARQTLAALAERGIRAEGLYSKGIDEVRSFFTPEIVVNISGRKVGLMFPGTRIVDWDVEDPFGSDLEIYRRISTEIETHMRELVKELKEQP
jgi:arsenate reductase (thioredoxin)